MKMDMKFFYSQTVMIIDYAMCWAMGLKTIVWYLNSESPNKC